MEDPKMKNLGFEDRFGLLVDVEYTTEKATASNVSSMALILTSLKRTWQVRINYISGRKLNCMLN